jgi:hypothetical protein
MKTIKGLVLLVIALLLSPFLGIARMFAPRGVDALNTQGTYEDAYTRSAEVAIAPYLLVTFGTAPGTQVKLNTASTRPLGNAVDEAAINTPVAVKPLIGPPRIMIASKAIAAGVRVYGTAAGKVTDAVVTGAYLVGEALNAAAADGSEFLVSPLSPVVNP